jgi:hypothetical protein
MLEACQTLDLGPRIPGEARSTRALIGPESLSAGMARHAASDGVVTVPVDGSEPVFMRRRPLRRPSSSQDAKTRGRSEPRRYSPASTHVFTVPKHECLLALKRAAATYMTDDRIIATTYNKAKHESTMF